MATFRTPVPTWHAQVSFVSNGELGSEAVLNRPGFNQDDKLQFLRNNQDSILADNSALQSAIGQPAGSASVVWNNNHNFSAGSTYKVAIEGVDQSLSQLAASADFTRIDNIDTFLIGEDSTSGQPPNWANLVAGPAHTFRYIQLGDTHHQALERLDIGASVLESKLISTSQVVKSLSVTSENLTTRMLDAEGNISTAQGDIDALESLTDTHTNNITVLENSMISVLGSQALIITELDAVSIVQSVINCELDRVKSQINELRIHTALGATIITWCTP
jgi:hypothetical protein